MEKLLFLRERLNVTQKAVADYIGLSRQAYAHYEFGDRYPDPKTLCKLADYFNVSVDYLLGRVDEQSFTPNTRNSHNYDEILSRTTPLDQLSPDEQELIEKYRKLSPAYKIKLNTYAEIFLEQEGDSLSVFHRG